MPPEAATGSTSRRAPGSSRPAAARGAIRAAIPRRPLPGLTLAPPGNHAMPVLRPAQEVFGEEREEPARIGEPGARRGLRAEYLGAVEGRRGEQVVRIAAGDRCPVPHVVLDDVPFAPAVPFPPDELLVCQETDRLGDGCGAHLQSPDQLG